MNENLRRALLRARLTDEDVAARLGVDPKTVRRWLEGRIPYLRHRWAMASLLGLDETDLWPQARSRASWPSEIQAVYPHSDAVPADMWRDLFDSAKYEIGILADSALFIADDAMLFSTLIKQAEHGVRERICLRDPDWAGSPDVVGRSRTALSRFRTLAVTHNVEIRVHRSLLYNAILQADANLVVLQRVFGLPSRQAPVLYLRQTDALDITRSYLESFNTVWSESWPNKGC